MRTGRKRVFTVLLYVAAAALIWQAVIPRSRIRHVSHVNRSFAFRFKKEKYVLEPGEMCCLKIFAINKRISFTSSDIKVASVLPGGRVLAHKEGRTVITAEADGKTITCVVIVKKRE